jgi:hypothetical protein
MAHPISRSEAQGAKEQKAEHNPQLRSRAEGYLSVMPALLVFVGPFLWLIDSRLIIVKNSAH